MPFNLSTGEIFVLLIVAVVIFGGSLPEVARKVGRGLAQFRRGMNEEMRRIEKATAPPLDDEPPPDWKPPPADGEECKGMEG